MQTSIQVERERSKLKSIEVSATATFKVEKRDIAYKSIFKLATLCNLSRLLAVE